jgi:Dolichyl-phosphate-mannose-protein mannosyltransferase
MNKRDDKSDIRATVLIFTVTLCIASIFALIGVDPHHDGVMLKPAIDVANGHVLFKDTFSMYGAGSIWLQAMAIRLFGEHLAVIRLLTAFAYALIAVLLFRIWRRLLPKWLAITSCFAWLSLAHFYIDHSSITLFPWATVYATGATLVVILLLFHATEDNRSSLWVSIGIASALTFWFKQNIGITTACSVVFYIVIDAVIKKKYSAGAVRLLLVVLGLLLINALVIGWLVNKGAFRDFWLQNIEYPRAFAKMNFYEASPEFIVSTMLKRMFLIGPKDAFTTSIWILLPLITIWFFIGSVLRLRHAPERAATDELTLILSAVSLFNWVNYYPIAAIFQIHMSATPMIGLLSLFLYDLLHQKLSLVDKLRSFTEDMAEALRYLTFNAVSIRSIGVFLMCLLLALMLKKDVSFRIHDMIRKIRINHHRITAGGVLQGMFVSKDVRQFYADLQRSMDAHFSAYPEGTIISLTGDALYTTFKKDNRMFSPMPMYWTWVNSFLYPTYIRNLRAEISDNKDFIISHYFVLDGYVPLGSYSLKGSFQEPFVTLVPGKRTDKCSVVVDRVNASVTHLTFRISNGSKGDVSVNSVIVHLINDDHLPRNVPDLVFDSEILPNINDDADKRFMLQVYAKQNEAPGQRILFSPLSPREFARIRNIYLNLFLNKRYIARWDTFEQSTDPGMYFADRSAIGEHPYKNDHMGLRVPGRQSVVFSLPYIMPEAMIGRTTVKIRLNYTNAEYGEYLLSI